MTELVFILDRSGSMSGLETDTIGGFNSMIDKQKREAGEALVSTVLFDNESVVIHDRLPLGKVPPMTEKVQRDGGFPLDVPVSGERRLPHHTRRGAPQAAIYLSPCGLQACAGQLPCQRGLSWVRRHHCQQGPSGNHALQPRQLPHTP